MTAAVNGQNTSYPHLSCLLWVFCSELQSLKLLPKLFAMVSLLEAALRVGLKSPTPKKTRRGKNNMFSPHCLVVVVIHLTNHHTNCSIFQHQTYFFSSMFWCKIIWKLLQNAKMTYFINTFASLPIRDIL